MIHSDFPLLGPMCKYRLNVSGCLQKSKQLLQKFIKNRKPSNLIEMDHQTNWNFLKCKFKQRQFKETMPTLEILEESQQG